MSAAERNIYSWILLLFAALFLFGCNAQLVDNPDGSGKIASSYLALVQAESAAVECLQEAEKIHDDKVIASYAAITAKLDSVSQAILLTVMSFNNRDSVAMMVDSCMGPVEIVATQYNLTDRQRIQSGERITTRAVGAGAAIGFGVIVGQAFESAVDGAKGDQYVNVGGRQVVQTDSIQTRGDGLGLGILNSGDTTAPTTPSATTPNGPVSSSGKGDLIGNTFNVNTGDGGTASQPVSGTVSSEPFTGEFTGGEGPQSVTTQPVGQ